MLYILHIRIVVKRHTEKRKNRRIIFQIVDILFQYMSVFSEIIIRWVINNKNVDITAVLQWID
jgi:hypothetical protein